MEVAYSNREIDEKYTDIKASLARIEVQTTKHNGRLSKMEGWRNFITGGLAVLSFIVVPTLIWALSTIVSISGKITALLP